MIIKKADSKESDFETLESLRKLPSTSAQAKKRITSQIKKMRAGVKGENEAAYEIDFHFGNSKNHAVIHDLRIECEGRIAQIDHLVIGRFLDIWVCESKSIAGGVAINELGEFTTFCSNKAQGIASPVEQNEKHLLVLKSLLKSGAVNVPKRLGFSIQPNLRSVVLVTNRSRITRPEGNSGDLENVIKNDQFKTLVDKHIDRENPIAVARLIGSNTLEQFAQEIAALHQPKPFRWAAMFGLSEVAEKPTQDMALRESEVSYNAGTSVKSRPSSKAGPSTKTVKKRVCKTCAVDVPYNVARFCWFNKPRFGGEIYCMECQKSVQASH